MTTKEKLLSTKYFVNNSYLDDYCELIDKNKSTEAKTYVTQSHHIIPGFVFRMMRADVDDSPANKVNLMFKDHVKAHYLLSLCGSDFHVCNKNYLAIKCLIDTIEAGFQENIDDETFESIQLLYEEIKHTGPLSPDTKDKISSAIKGRISITKDGHYKYIYPEQLATFLSEGWTRGHNNMDNEARTKIRQAQLGRVRMHKDSKIVAVKAEDVDNYLSQGYVIGEPPREWASNKGKVAVRKNNRVKYVDESEIQTYLDDGYELGGTTGRIGAFRGKTFSDEHKQRIGDKHRGRVHIHKGNKRLFIFPAELQVYLDDGYVLGSGVTSVGAAGKIWMSNAEGVTKYVKEELEQSFLDAGWQRGRRYKK